MRQHATDSGRVNLRVAGICIVDEHVLLQSDAQIDYWVLPGGRPLLLESSRDALRREMREEIDAEVEVGRLLWTIEDFFEFDRGPSTRSVSTTKRPSLGATRRAGLSPALLALKGSGLCSSAGFHLQGSAESRSTRRS